jgi:hypothetical protein
MATSQLARGRDTGRRSPPERTRSLPEEIVYLLCAQTSELRDLAHAQATGAHGSDDFGVSADRKLTHRRCGLKLGLVKQESQGFCGVLRG